MKIQAKLAMGISTMAIILLSGCGMPKKDTTTTTTDTTPKAVKDFCALLYAKSTTCHVEMSKCSTESMAALTNLVACLGEAQGDDAKKQVCKTNVAPAMAKDMVCMGAWDKETDAAGAQ